MQTAGPFVAQFGKTNVLHSSRNNHFCSVFNLSDTDKLRNSPSPQATLDINS
ncbi:hypothetical protein BCV71DRAFT_274679, partial [Rhizopus microsporus]